MMEMEVQHSKSFEQVCEAMRNGQYVPLPEFYAAFDKEVAGHTTAESTSQPTQCVSIKPVFYYRGMDAVQNELELADNRKQLAVLRRRAHEAHRSKTRGRWLQLFKGYNDQKSDDKARSGLGPFVYIKAKSKHGRDQRVSIPERLRTRGLKLKGSKYPKRSQRIDRQEHLLMLEIWESELPQRMSFWDDDMYRVFGVEDQEAGEVEAQVLVDQLQGYFDDEVLGAEMHYKHIVLEQAGRDYELYLEEMAAQYLCSLRWDEAGIELIGQAAWDKDFSPKEEDCDDEDCLGC